MSELAYSQVPSNGMASTAANLMANFDRFHGQQRDGELFYSLCFQRYESLGFYSKLLQKLLTFAKSFDEGTPASRENVWTQLYSLMGTSAKDFVRDGPLFSPLLSTWLQEPTINLFGLELLYVAFMNSTSANADANLNSVNSVSKEGMNTFSPWGSTIPCALYQLSLLQHWESKLEKLSVMHKKAIWNTCRLIPTFSNYDESSFRKTFARWASNPLMNLTYITTLFSSIGYLKDMSILKCDFCYPKTTIPVFPMKNAANANNANTMNTNNPNTTTMKTDTMNNARISNLIDATNNAHKMNDDDFSYGPSKQMPSFSYDSPSSSPTFSSMRARSPTLPPIASEDASLPHPASSKNPISNLLNEKTSNVVHPYRRNSSVDFQTLVASALTNLQHYTRPSPLANVKSDSPEDESKEVKSSSSYSSESPCSSPIASKLEEIPIIKMIPPPSHLRPVINSTSPNSSLPSSNGSLAPPPRRNSRVEFNLQSLAAAHLAQESQNGDLVSSQNSSHHFNEGYMERTSPNAYPSHHTHPFSSVDSPLHSESERSAGTLGGHPSSLFSSATSQQYVVPGGNQKRRRSSVCSEEIMRLEEPKKAKSVMSINSLLC